MCGIVGMVAERDVTPILLEGLKRLEYRGYDSAGVAVINGDENIHRIRTQGKVSELVNACEKEGMPGAIGIAHTRWATHGEPSERNAHPQLSGTSIAIVHNGIIENYEEIRNQLKQKGYNFDSETDTETVVHLIEHYYQQTNDLLEASRLASQELKGAYALAIMHQNEKDRLIVTRRGCPLVIGLGIGENFVASDQLALLPVTQNFVYLEEGDIADVQKDQYTVYDNNKNEVKREVHTSELTHDDVTKGKYRHYMEKEIYQQPSAIAATLEGRISDSHVLEEIFGANAPAIFEKTKQVQIIACGTSFHASLVAKYWLESFANIPCRVEIASEFRYRDNVVLEDTLFVSISQSGETADTLAALRKSKDQNFIASLAICNVPESAIVRESDLVFMTRAGSEIGVASTKAFTTQLTALMMLTVAIGRHHGLSEEKEAAVVNELQALPGYLKELFVIDKEIKEIAEIISKKHHTLFLGRGVHYPIALEGALKLKEISYIHAEAYPAGELKHGPLALVDEHMPVVAIAPNDSLVEKLISNLQEVKARGGILILFADQNVSLGDSVDAHVIKMPPCGEMCAPLAYTIPLQLLAYHVAVIKGTDVDQPRNLAKSVTVE